MQNKKVKIREEEIDDIGVQFKKYMKNDDITSKKIENKTKKSYKYDYSLLITLIVLTLVISGIPTIALLYTEYPEMFKYIGYAAVLIISVIIAIRTIKSPEKDASFYKPIYGLLITLVIFCIKPALDIYYYVAGLTSIAFSIWSFYDIVTQFNLLTTRKLPQLGARGGDENA